MRIPIRLSSNVERAIPIAIMATIALASFLLLKSTAVYSPSNVIQSKADLDYYLHRFSTAQLSSDGTLKSLIRGHYAEHSQIATNTKVKDFVFTSIAKHNSYFGHADTAVLSDDSNQLLLKDNASITRKASVTNTNATSTKIDGDQLRFIQYPEVLIADLPVLIEQGKRRITANSMRYDADQQVMKLQGVVKVKGQAK